MKKDWWEKAVDVVLAVFYVAIGYALLVGYMAVFPD